MDASTANRTSDDHLAAAIVKAYVDAGMAKPSLPDGLRDEVVFLLNGLMADPDRFDAYRALLMAELNRQNARQRLLTTGGAGLDIPAEQIAREGFANVPDEYLADIAVSPEAIEAVREYLNDADTEVSPWRVEAILAVEDARPSASEAVEKGRAAFERFASEHIRQSDRPATLPLGQPRRARFARWAGQSIGIAAGLLLAFLLGTQMRTGDSDLDATGARVTPGGALGGQAWTIQVPSSRRAFVTLAIFKANNLPDYHPESGKLLEALPDKPLSYTVEGQAGDSLFLILTETPATDVLNNATALAVNQKRQSWNDADSFGRFLDETLRSLGYKHFSVRRISLAR